jgi:hypothetical protein
MPNNLTLEILDYNWHRLWVSPNVVSARKIDELGAVGEGEVVLPLDDEALQYLPDPSSPQANEGRWRLYEDGELTFAGVVDQTTREVTSDYNYQFGGKQRGILLGVANEGRRDFNGWPVHTLFQELLWDNIGKAPIATVFAYSDAHELHPPINAMIGDIVEGNYWGTQTSGTQHFMTMDLGGVENLVGVRVIPPWWDQRFYHFSVETSEDAITYIPQGMYAQNLPLSDKGALFTFDAPARYVRVNVVSSSDEIGRIAAILPYRELATVGPDTTYLIPWIENDDSGNIYDEQLGASQRVLENGSFNGDGILGNSFVTRLLDGGIQTHVFRGTTNSVYFTQGTTGGNGRVAFYLDNEFQAEADVVSGTYQTKAFEIVNLSNDLHHLKVVQISGTPQIDYFTGLFQSSYRPIRDDDSAIGYAGGWEERENERFSNQFTHGTKVSGSTATFTFTGDLIKAFGKMGPVYGVAEFYIDGFLEDAVDLYSASEDYQQVMFAWSGSYGDHEFMMRNKGSKNPASGNYWTDLDHLTGNFAHVIYLRSFYETNLRLLTRLSEITNTFLRFNHDGSIDLLGSVGDYSNTIIREGENEGGTIINASAEHDYSETASAVLALVTGPGDMPIKAFVIDREAVKRMGLKIRKAEEADANDAYLLTRQAWSELQEYKEPQKRFTVDFDPSEVGDIQVGQTTVLHSQRLGLTNNELFRAGRLTTEWTNE